MAKDEKRKSTVAELEAILAGPDCPIETLSNGEIRAITGQRCPFCGEIPQVYCMNTEWYKGMVARCLNDKCFLCGWRWPLKAWNIRVPADDTMQATMLPTMQALEAAIAYCEREIADDPAMLGPDTEIGHLYPMLKIAVGK